MKESIIKLMHEVAQESGGQILEKISDETVLLSCGLDSLGFAILVARLEEEFGYDPFTLLEQPVYPRTFGEFLAIYERFK